MLAVRPSKVFTFPDTAKLSNMPRATSDTLPNYSNGRTKTMTNAHYVEPEKLQNTFFAVPIDAPAKYGKQLSPTLILG